ncbi:MAG: protein translocase subunit SecF [Gammaproteobacteria bacterium]|nr:protein translocase subunit SecF [Gammaproteobacteria bacterium]
MNLFSGKTTIDFMGKRHIGMTFSAILMAVAVYSLLTRGLVLGIDFTGGTVIEVGYQQPVAAAEVRQILDQAGFSEAVVQSYGGPRELLIRLAPRQEESSAQLSNRVLEALSQGGTAQVEMRRVEYVGPQVGDELIRDGILAVIYALIGILIYVAVRFEKRFSLGAVLALFHDVVITLGVFSLFGIEFDLTVLAAILAIIGYSINDTIVVYDRVREGFRRLRRETPQQVVNISINETLSRTINTSLTVLLVVVALFLFGGEVIHGFALAMIIGVGFGTYSSVYVASALTLMLGVSREDLLPPHKEGADKGEAKR